MSELISGVTEIGSGKGKRVSQRAESDDADEPALQPPSDVPPHGFRDHSGRSAPPTGAKQSRKERMHQYVRIDIERLKTLNRERLRMLEVDSNLFLDIGAAKTSSASIEGQEDDEDAIGGPLWTDSSAAEAAPQGRLLKQKGKRRKTSASNSSLTEDTSPLPLETRPGPSSPKEKGERRPDTADVPYAAATTTSITTTTATAATATATSSFSESSALHTLTRMKKTTLASLLLEDDRLPYTFHKALAQPSRYPPLRRFCAICGAESKYMCVTCGTRVCSLHCKEVHAELRCRQFSR